MNSIQADKLIYEVLLRSEKNQTVSNLIQLTGKQETSWLEFKAALFPKDGYEKNENHDDYRWNLAKAVIAFANTMGGAVLLGVDDNADPVGLEYSDPRNICSTMGKDSFIRQEVVRALNPENGWKTKKKGHLKASPTLPVHQYEIRIEAYYEKDVVLILVHPIKEGGEH